MNPKNKANGAAPHSVDPAQFTRPLQGRVRNYQGLWPERSFRVYLFSEVNIFLRIFKTWNWLLIIAGGKVNSTRQLREVARADIANSNKKLQITRFT